MGNLINYKMKFTVFVALLGSTQAIRMKTPGDFYPAEAGIDKKSLMDVNPSHWRKSWPEGCTDGGAGDAEFNVVDEFNHPAPPKPSGDYVWPTWNEYEPHTLGMNDENQGRFH